MRTQVRLLAETTAPPMMSAAAMATADAVASRFGECPRERDAPRHALSAAATFRPSTNTTAIAKKASSLLT